MRTRSLRFSFALACSVAVATPAAADIYEWTDASGNAQFTTDLAKVPASQREAATARARERAASQPPAARAAEPAAAAATAGGTRVRGLMESHLSPEAFAAWRADPMQTPRPADAASAPNGVWGVMMETGLESGSSTLLIRSDGTTDLWLSVGGGFVWGGDVPAINASAKRLVALAAREAAKFAPVPTTALPRLGEVQFTLLTANGMRGARVTRSALGTGKHPLSAVYHAGHGVLTALREEAEAKGLGL